MKNYFRAILVGRSVKKNLKKFVAGNDKIINKIALKM